MERPDKYAPLNIRQTERDRGGGKIGENKGEGEREGREKERVYQGL